MSLNKTCAVPEGIANITTPRDMVTYLEGVRGERGQSPIVLARPQRKRSHCAYITAHLTTFPLFHNRETPA